ncbi:MAG: XRE family transcriptional regulator [Eggerthellaceae bacterium]|jgi:repressor LexA|nr:XRE family transcriptional regulator [Eggerthellaceae bacterium]MCH4220465.1 XRE family transcriptional regulator [Eggerthellaceae bacterium]
MDSFSRNIKKIREDHGLTQQEFADSVGVTSTTVSSWETRNKKPRGTETLKAICDAYRVTESDLFGFSDGYYAKSTGAHILQGAKQVMSDATAYAPLVGRVHAGTAQEPDILDEQIPVPSTVYAHYPDMYVLEVEGNCMDKVYPEGCHIGISPSKAPSNGSIAVVMIDGNDAIIRRLYRGNGTFMLVCDSYESDYDDIVLADIDNHDVTFCGCVVWFQAAKELD